MAAKKDIMAPVPVRDMVCFDGLTADEITALYVQFAEATGIPVGEVRVEEVHGWDDSSWYLTGLRPPTEKEIAARKAAAEKTAERSRKMREAREAKERAEFERLNAKYGPKA